jgi:hypothetical protein
VTARVTDKVRLEVRTVDGDVEVAVCTRSQAADFLYYLTQQPLVQVPETTAWVSLRNVVKCRVGET